MPRNYMEETKINAVQQNQRYTDSSYWWMGGDGFYYGAFGLGWGWGLMDTWAGVGDQHWCTTTVEVMVVDFMADSMVEVVSMEEEEGNAKPGANEPGFVFVRVMI